LSLLFVDISLQRSAKAEKCKYFPLDRFCDDHGCRDRKPNGGSASAVESQAASPASTFHDLGRPRRSGAASKISSISRRRISGSISSPLAAAGRSARGNLQPFIVIAYDAERRPLLLLPLALRHEHGVRTACFMGGKHATFNMALWDRDFAAAATTADLDALISAIRKQSAADVLALSQQPLRWQDVSNPMALLPHQPSANDCPLMTMTAGAEPASLISNSFRRRLKGKERKLQTLAGYRYRWRPPMPRSSGCSTAFFRIKPLRMAEQKLPNVFAEPGVEDFIRGACMTPLTDGGHVIDIHALECDDEVIAIFAGVADKNRFSMMFNTYTMSGNSRYSPGLILMRNIIDHYAGRGFRALDLGIGSDDYKRLFCKATSRFSIASSRSACAVRSRPPRCQASTAPSIWSSIIRRCSR
jgi:CelD/BcsL family acetyltransferase involved in cellulose biosynthesis